MSRKAYDTYCGELCRNFDKGWDQVGKKLDFAFGYLEHIADDAWKQMTQMAIERWERWPTNFVKATKELYSLWSKSVQSVTVSEHCEYCNGNGFFSATKWVDVRPGVSMSYTHTFRCAACRNWFGKLGIKIPALYPLEAKSRGYWVTKYPPPIPDNAIVRPLPELLAGVGQHLTPEVHRPPQITYNEPWEYRDDR